MAKALLIPLGQRALRLKTQPAPGNLDGHRADVGVAGFGDALLVSGVATRIGGGRQAAQGADFLPIAKRPPAEELHHKQPGTIDPNPFDPSLKTIVHALWDRTENQSVTQWSFDACI